MTRTRLVLVVLAAVGLGWTTTACADGSSTPDLAGAEATAAADHLYRIPAGTGNRLDRGERVEIIPAELEVRVGEVIRIVNDDDRGHVIGAFYVGAGETLSQRFSSPGELSGECTVHPSGSFTLTVRA